MCFDTRQVRQLIREEMAKHRNSISFHFNFEVEYRSPKGCNKMRAVRSIRNKKGELAINIGLLLEMAGINSRSRAIHQDGDLIWSDEKGPFRQRDINREANKIIEKARGWLKKELPGVNRKLKLNNSQVIELWRHSMNKNFQIVHVSRSEMLTVVSKESLWTWTRRELFGKVQLQETQIVKAPHHITETYVFSGVALLMYELGESGRMKPNFAHRSEFLFTPAPTKSVRILYVADKL